MSQWNPIAREVRIDLVLADRFERLDWLGRLVWVLNHPDDELGWYWHLIDSVARKYGDRDLGLTRKRLTIQDVLRSELKRLHKTGGHREQVQGLRR